MRTFRGRIATLGSVVLFTAVVAPPPGGVAAREERESVWLIAEGEAMSPAALIPRSSIDTPTVGPLIRIQSPPLDSELTPRFKLYLKENRLFVEKANVPRGRHRVEISIADHDGNTTVAILQLMVK